MSSERMIKLLLLSSSSSAELVAVDRIDYDPTINDGVVMKPTWLLRFDVMEEEDVLSMSIEISTTKLVELELDKHEYVVALWEQAAYAIVNGV